MSDRNFRSGRLLAQFPGSVEIRFEPDVLPGESTFLAPMAGRTVRVRTIDDVTDVALFRRAFERACSLRAENVVRVLRVHLYEDLHFVVEELVEGVRLRTWLERERRLPFLEARLVLLAIARALVAAEAAGIAHGDLRCERATWTGSNLVLDGFGIAEARGFRPTAADDVRAFGAIAHEVLSGERFVAGSPAVNRLREHVPPGLARLIVRCLDESLDARPTAREIARMVDGLVTPNPAYRAPHLVAQARFLARRRGDRLVEAEARCGRAVEVDPSHAAAHAAYAELAARRALRGATVDASRATASADRARDLDPRLAEAHVARALCDLAFRGDLASARARVEAAIAFDGPSRAALVEAAVLAARAGDALVASRHAAEAARAAPRDPCAWRALGWASLAGGDADRAIEAFTRAFELARSDEDRRSVERALRVRAGSPHAASDVLG